MLRDTSWSVGMSPPQIGSERCYHWSLVMATVWPQLRTHRLEIGRIFGMVRIETATLQEAQQRPEQEHDEHSSR